MASDETIQILAETNNGKRTATFSRVIYPAGTQYRVSVSGGNTWESYYEDEDGFADMLQLFAHVSGELAAMNRDVHNANEMRGADMFEKRSGSLLP